MPRGEGGGCVYHGTKHSATLPHEYEQNKASIVRQTDDRAIALLSRSPLYYIKCLCVWLCLVAHL